MNPVICVRDKQSTVLQIMNTKSYCKSLWVPSPIFRLGLMAVYALMSLHSLNMDGLDSKIN